MTIPYTKLPLSFQEQVTKLSSRGLAIGNPEIAEQKLANISYYRLSAYWYPFRQRTGGNISQRFRAGASFEDAVNLYEFDRKLRMLLMDAIERVEIAVRTQVTYVMAHRYGAFAHTDPHNFHDKFGHTIWLEKIDAETTRSKEAFIEHYRGKYDGFPTLPIWMLTEVMSLGTLSFLYYGIKNGDKADVALKFDMHYRKLGDWLHALTYVRNVCAHHGRIWNRELAIRASIGEGPDWKAPVTPTNSRIFYILLVLRYLLRKTGNGDAWAVECNELLQPIVDNPMWRSAMGFPHDWKNHPIWH